MDAISDSWVRHCNGCSYLAYVRRKTMIKDELTREINNCTSWHVVCHDGNMIRIITENEDTFMELPDDVEYLEDISVNWEALKTTKNRSLGNVYALLNLINDYVNTPVEQRN